VSIYRDATGNGAARKKQTHPESRKRRERPARSRHYFRRYEAE
jgi:hypothetical protein